MTRLRHLLLLTTALVAFGVAPALAGPNGPSVVGGAATVVNPGTANVTVNQSSDKAIINWHAFDVGANETIRFNQPSSSSIILNRVTGGLGPSQILGVLDANGRVFLINRDGILFGPNSKVNAASFLATTSDIKNQDFMAGRFNFGIPGRPDASIVNLGTITAQTGGFAALVAPGVRNSGTITATLGTVSLASGTMFNLDFYGDKLVTLGIGDEIASSVKDVATGLPLSALVTNDGKIKANGGRVELTAASARQVVDAVINTSGVIEANTVGTHNGTIVLGAATAATKLAGAPTQTVKIAGTIKASAKKPGTKGGTIVVTGENIQVANATINASGPAAGGKILIGGDWGAGHPDTSLVANPSAKLESFAVPTATTVSVDAATTINASATQVGNGGKVILWSDQQTSFAGTILALGGKTLGDGGFAEVSSHGVLNYTGVADLRATNGKFGTLLLDPYDVTISDRTDTNSSFASGTFTPTGTSIINYLTLQTALGNASVLITTGGTGSPGADVGNINISHSFTWSNASTLTLSAYNNIVFNGGVVVANTGAGSLILRADNSGTGTGYVSISSPSVINWSASTGAVSIYYSPIAGYTFPNYPTDYHSVVTTNPAVLNQLTAYMLVNNVTNLANISTNINGTYALGKNIDASSNPNFAPIADIAVPFKGILDGNGGLGVNYTISNLTIKPTTGLQNVGLFGAIDTTGVVRNLTITNASVTADPNAPSPGQFVGIVAGTNAGTISNVTVSGAVTNGVALNGLIAGGLVGQNGDIGLNHPGTIVNSHAAVNVAVGNATSGSTENIAGGLVGSNPGTITSSDASGMITGGNYTVLGGLAGTNNATITSSFATGSVTINALFGIQTNAGGLVGFNVGAITNSNASGAITGSSPDSTHNAALGGLVGLNESGTITNSFATGAITGGHYTWAGGLVGFNNATVTDSHATSSVTISDQTSVAGGLVGFNFGTITGTTPGAVFAATTVTVSGNTMTAGGLVGTNALTGTINNANATGTVSMLPGSVSINLGGLAGFNSGTITNSTAAATVTGGPGATGGLVGLNYSLASIASSSATGNVTATGMLGAFAYVGGLVGSNLATAVITNSTATGTVTTNGFAHAGGLIGDNSASLSNLSAGNPLIVSGTNVTAGGLIGENNAGATITSSRAFGTITSTATTASFIGGLIGENLGTVTGMAVAAPDQSCTAAQSCATGAIAVVTGSTAGGLIGGNSGTVTNSYATGAVTVTETANSTFASSAFGGLIGLNMGTVTDSHAAGNLTATFGTTTSSNIALGGLVGNSSGPITSSFAIGNVTATVNNGGFSYFVYLGGLIGQQTGSTVLSSYATGTVTSTYAAGNYSYFDSYVGGLIGWNSADVTNSFASGAITLTNSFGTVGGLIGVQSGGTITNATATGNINISTDANSTLFGIVGGLIGETSNTAVIGSHANGNITWTVTGTPTSLTFGGEIGGLIGLTSSSSISNSYATGNVTAANGTIFNIVGGLVGISESTAIDSSFATGNVTGSTIGGTNNIYGYSYSAAGGLVGYAVLGSITNSYATGNVTTWGDAGGLVGANFGDITSSHATGAVTGLGHSFTYTYTDPILGTYTYNYIPSVGGLVGLHELGTISNSYATGNVTARGLVGGLVGSNNGATITTSYATGAVTEGPANNDAVVSSLGGLIGGNNGTVTASQASGPVTGGDGAIVGGFVGINFTSLIQNSSATGAVTGGNDSLAGGFVGVNVGTISQSFSTGNVTVGDPSLAGGLVGLNFGIVGYDITGRISQAYATGTVTGGPGSVVAALVAQNAGTIDQTYAGGLVTGGPGGITGGLVALNSSSVPSSLQSLVNAISTNGSTPAFTPAPATVTNSYWDTTTTGLATSAAGTPQTTTQLTAGVPSGFDTTVWSSSAGHYPCLNTACSPAPTPGPAVPVVTPPVVTPPVVTPPVVTPPVVTPPVVIPPVVTPVVTPPVIVTVNPQFISPLLLVAVELVKETAFNNAGLPGEVVNTQPVVNPSHPNGPAGTHPLGHPPGGPGANVRLPTGLPPLNETRFITNEVLLQIRADATPERVAAVARALGLEILAMEDFGLLGRRAYRFRITGGRSVRDMIPLLEANAISAQAQPVYVFELSEAAAAPAESQGDSAQYIVSKLRLPEVHLLATGKDVLVAVVDSAIDVNHPDLAGVIAGKYDSANADEKPHPHGTGMAGAIASHKRLLGIAPNVKILAIQAFGVNTGSAQGTSLNIVKGLNWAVEQGAKVVNMSFAGPMDPILQQAIKAMHDKGIVLIAAAGNAGPKSPPLYPGADPNVIAVSATDADDQTYKNANRGKYVAISAPGVDILVPAPDGGYQLTTGTSVAAAHISGVAALLLERNPGLKPDELKKILMSTADKPPGAKPEDIGAGLVDPLKALQKAAPKSAGAQ